MAYTDAFGDIFMKVLDSLANQEDGVGAGIPFSKAVPIINSIGGGFGAVDVMEGENSIDLYFDLPGVLKSDIKLDITRGIKDNVLKMSVTRQGPICNKNSERYRGTKTREIALPNDINSSSITASYNNGVLTVNIKKNKSEMPSKSIPIN